jgi:hypothetical protein
MMSTGEHALPERPRCPYCGVAFDACKDTNGDPRGPEPGDISCCVYCGGFAVFSDGLRLRRMTPAEAARLDAGGAGFPRAVAEASVEEYRSMLLDRALREVFDRKEESR